MNGKFFTLPEEKQKRIINAAYVVFAGSSYQKASMSRIAAAGGISKSLLFHYFQNKKELYLYLWENINRISCEIELKYYKETTDFFEIMTRKILARCEFMGPATLEETGFRPIRFLQGSHRYLVFGTWILCGRLSAVFIFPIAVFLMNPSYRGSVSKQIEEKTHSGKVYDRVVNGLIPRTRWEKSYFVATALAAVGIILIMTAICLAGCTKEEAFVDSCDSEIAEQVTSIMQESQEGRRRLIDEVESAGAGEDEESDGVFPIVTSEPVSILTTEEEQNLWDEAMSAAEQCGELYKEAEIVYPETEYSRIEGFSDQQRKEVVKRLGEQGLVSVSDDINMENYQKMQDFYSAYVFGRDAMVTVFSVYMDGNIGALTFIHRNGKVQSFYVSVGWREGGMPEIKGFGSRL